MKFTAEIMDKMYKKNREKLILKTFRALKKEIKEYARDGYKSKIIELTNRYTDEEQEKIINYFVEKGFDVEWICNDEVRITWSKKRV